MRRLALAFTTTALCLVFAVVTLAQSDTAQISGYVKDPTGAVVPNANVTVRNEATGLERQARSSDTGYYVVSNLPPGFYTVTAEVQGFKRAVKTQNKLDPSIASTVDLVLEVGSVAEVVEVVASVSQLQSETAMVGKLIDSSQLQMMSLNGRNPLFLALLKPGVRGGSMQGFSFGLSSGGLSINGARTQDFVITYDGAVAIRTRANGTSVGTVDVDSVQEIQILTANYTAEYGRSSGGQVRMVTKSGSRSFHGSVYEYFRNNNLDANTWSRNRAGLPREARKFNQFGYYFSGPAYIPGKWNTDKNKLFFLWSQEWVRFRRELTSIVTVPTLLMRQGNFSELLNPSNTFFARAVTVRDPETGQPFPNNIIPPDRVSSNGLGFLRAFPEPTPGFLQGRNNFIQTRPQPENQRKDTISVDFLPTERHSFRFRHQIYNWVSVDAFRGGLDRAVTDWNRPNKTVSLNYVWTINPNTINEFQATASVDRVFIGVFREGGRFQRSKYGINYPYLFPERKEIFDKIPTITIANFQEVDGGPYPSSSTGPIYVFSDNLTKIRGNHTLKFGFLYERSGQNDFDQINVSGVPGGTNNQNGRFVYSDTRTGATTTGLAIANAAMGLYTTYTEIGQRAFTPYRSNMYEWFAQDSWKVTPKMRLELGLRHTLMTPYYFSLWGNMAVFDPRRYDPARAAVQDRATGFVISGDRYNGICIPGTSWPGSARGRVALADDRSFDRFCGGGRAWGEYQKFNFQPRVGLAYQITPKTVFRSGLGRFMAKPGVSDNIFLGGNPPLQPMVSIANGQADNPSGGRPSNFPLYFMTSDPVFKIPTSYMWNFTLERDVGWGTMVQVGYVGRVGLFLERVRNINQLATATLQRPENAGVNTNVLRPYKGFGEIHFGETAARSKYNGLQIEVNRRFAKGLSYGLSYTYSSSKDNASQRRDIIPNNFDDRAFWGPSAFDTRHMLVVNAAYQLPFFQDQSSLKGKLLGGWRISGATQAQTGVPFTVGTNDDFAGVGSVGNFQDNPSSNRAMQMWNLSGNATLPRDERKFSQGVVDQNFYIRTGVFSAPAAGAFANQTRNLFNHPGLQNWNLAVLKDFSFSERQKFQFRAEFFNWINHPNWEQVETNPRSGTFGRVTGKTSNERDVQLSLRYSF